MCKQEILIRRNTAEILTSSDEVPVNIIWGQLLVATCLHVVNPLWRIHFTLRLQEIGIRLDELMGIDISDSDLRHLGSKTGCT